MTALAPAPAFVLSTFLVSPHSIPASRYLAKPGSTASVQAPSTPHGDSMRHRLLAGLGLALACAHPASAPAASRFVQDPYPSTYRPVPSAPVLISHATVLDGTGRRLEDADVLLADGRVVAVGSALQAPADAVRVDGRGKWVTPGIIDVHS